MALVTSNINRVTTRHSDLVCVSPFQMRIFEMLAIGACDVFPNGADTTLRCEGMPSITLETYTETLDDLVNRGLIERFSNSIQLADGVWLLH